MSILESLQNLGDKILHRESTVNTQIKEPQIDPTQVINDTGIKRLLRDGYDVEFLAKTQPQGGITFDDDHAIGDGYSACVNILQYPTDPNILWATQVMLNDSTVAIMDVKTASSERLKNEINRSLQELGDQATNGRKATSMSDAQDNYQDLMDLSSSISRQGEIPKKIVSRIFVYAPTIESLQEKIRDLIKSLKGNDFRATVYNFTQADQYKSMTQKLTKQERSFAAVPEQIMPARTLGFGNPFSFQSLKDPRGIPLGTTSAGGAFIFDQFRSTNTRRSFNMMVLGKMGAGKSTLLKMLTEGSFARNMYWRGIDKSGEYVRLVRALGGVVVNLDGSEGMINPLEVMATVTDKEGKVVDEVASFMQHLDKVSVLFKMVNRDFAEIEIQDFKNILRSFYIYYGLLPKDWQRNPGKVRLTGKDPQDYPTFSEFSRYVDKCNSEEYLSAIHASPQRRRTFEKIKIGVEAMIDNYGQMFDGHSSMKDLSREKVVLFDTSTVANQGSVYQAQIFSTLSLIWNQALQNGRRQNYLLDNGVITNDEISYFDVVLDECHNIVNYKNMNAVTYIKDFEREMRKFNAGIIFATQSPEEMVPDKVNSVEQSDLKVVFDLCAIKVMMAMENSQLAKIKKLLGDSLMPSDYSEIPSLTTGNAIWTLGSGQRYKVTNNPDPEQLKLFDGGQ
ncbi:ATP-binding protein [Lactobacillus gasseri]|uniref:ATP-binding protein n=4 Tax=Bacteria TaxID=2 RepID=A0ABY3BFC7_LACGS|nr:ATP-binding protein [Lactobacillus gasseri]MDT9590675.1 ATP-binding protein [Lactobacillus gasseri]MDT9611854.1 ATP-binding protein [Lactobacillus gasseri]TQW15315.1 hypothetical protein FIPPAONL_00975 [Lactobacillus gasseri]